MVDANAGMWRFGLSHFLHVPSPVARFRLRNKKGGAAGRVFPLAPGVMGKTFTLEAGLHADAPAGAGQGLKGESATVLMETSGTHHKLISRGADTMEDTKRAAPNGSGGPNGSNELTGNRNASTEQ